MWIEKQRPVISAVKVNGLITALKKYLILIIFKAFSF